MKILCTICARGGSKGVPNKNIREIAGKPLIAHSLLQARETGLFKHIGVSSDSDLILTTAKEWGSDILIKRPDELAQDHSAKLPVIRHCVLECEKIAASTFDLVVDLDATSPLRNAGDIAACVQLLTERKASNVITAAPSRRSPYFNLVELSPDGTVRLSKSLDRPVVRRQDAPACYDMNASIYVWTRAGLFNSETVFQPTTALYVMPEERSIDIDSELDFKIVNMLLSQGVKTS